MTRIATIISLSLLAFGCSEIEPIDEPPDPIDGQVLAGSAELDGTGFVPVADGTDVELIPGAQGGFHVWLNVSVHGVAGKVYVRRDAHRVVDEARVLRGLPQVLQVPDDAMEDWWDSPDAAPAFMCPSPIGIQVFDEELTFTVTLTDEDERVLATDQIVLTPRCPEGAQAAFCRQICAG